MKRTVIGFVMLMALYSCHSNESGSAFTGTLPDSKVASVGTLPDQSLFNLPDTFQTQERKQVTLSQFAGKPTLVAMIFTHCTYACPRLTADIQQIEKQLKGKSSGVNFVLVSFDVERDQPQQLKHYADEMKLDKNWTLLHGNEEAIRTLSVLLNVHYLKNTNGDFSHSNLVSVLSPDGMLQFQKEGLEADHSETIQRIEALMK